MLTSWSNFGKLQSKVLINLFKSYCCSFYGSHSWKFNSTGFDKCCKAWNIAIRKLLELPYNAHVYLLGPLVRQINIGEQFYVRNFRFLWNAFCSRNHIVSTCMNIALDNSNTWIGYKLAFYRYRYNIGMYSNINSSIKLLSASNISDEQVAIVNNLSTLYLFLLFYVYIYMYVLYTILCMNQINNNILHACYVVLTPGEIFENILLLKRFGLNLKRILKKKWLLSYRNGDITYREC